MKNIFFSLAIIFYSIVAFPQAGSLDPTFNGTGYVTTDFSGNTDWGNAMAIQTDGKIVVAGQTTNGSIIEFAVTRYNTNGTLDNTFGTGGKVITSIGSSYDAANAIAIQTDGKIVVAGYSDDGTKYNFAIVRYSTNGTLDNTFGTGGKVTTPLSSSWSMAEAVKIQSNGKILVAGSSYKSDTTNSFTVVRYNANGTLDNTFNSTGKTFWLTGQVYSISIQSDGKIVTAGVSNYGSDANFVVERLNSNGTLDDTFNKYWDINQSQYVWGFVITPIGSGNDIGTSVVIQGNQKIVVAGYSNNGTNNDFALVRYNTDGTLDNAFGTSGKVTTSLSSSNDFAYSVAIQADGNIVVAGTSTTSKYAVARYNTVGTLDNTFGTGGTIAYTIGSSGKAVAIQNDGKIVTAGSKGNDFAVARYFSCTVPSTPTAGNNGPVCTGTILSLNASTISGATYYWTGPNGFTSTLQNPSVSGSVTTAMAGTYFVKVVVDSCISIAGTTVVSVNPVYVYTENQSICAGDSYYWHGTNYTTANTYTASYTSIHGCDSIYTLHLTVNPVYAYTENHSICAGDSYNWHGTNYTTANTYTASYTSIHGCDSIYTLHLTVNPVYAYTENHSICAGDSYNWHGTNYTTANTYTASYTSIHGCDSVYTLHLTVNPVYAYTENHSICAGDSYNWHGTNYTTANTYTASYTSIHGCDSIYTLHLTVNPVYAYTENHSICAGNSYNWHGTNYTTANTYTASYTSIHGCDSIYTLHLTVNPVYAYTENHSICPGDSYSWHGTNYTTPNTYTASYTSIHGCDSIYTLHLTVNPVYSYSENHSICAGDSYNWHGTNYTTANTYTASYTSIHGCDSIYTLHLTVNPVYAYTENHSICAGNSYNWHGTNYTTANTYTASYTSIHGCDSIYTLHLTVNPVYAYPENHSICPGDSYSWHGTNYTTANTYTASYTSIHGCDSIYTLHLTVNPVYAYSENHSICAGDSYNWHGTNYSTANTYTASYTSIHGCDSVYTLILTVVTVDIGVTLSGVTITTDSLADSYQWLDCNNAFAIIPNQTAQSFTATANGSFAVKVMQGLCSDTSACVQITTVGIISNQRDDLFVYPNPVSNELVIELKGNKEKINFEIINSIGQIVYKGNLTEKTVVQTTNFARGVYLIKLDNNKTFEFRKIIKE